MAGMQKSGELVGVGSLLPPRGSWGLKSSTQVYWQVLLPLDYFSSLLFFAFLCNMKDK